MSDEAGEQSPEISVVIPTRGREARLAFALEALGEQTLDPERFEVVVVRADDRPAPAAELPEGLRVRSMTAPASRPGQRNVGWRAARGRLIAFTDDDCRPEPGWLEELLARDGGEGVFVQGRTEPDPDEIHLLHGLARSVRVDAPSPWHETCNIAYPRALLDRLGGFDEAFESSGEDTDLGLRAIEEGASPAYAPAALVHHAVVARPLNAAIRDGLTRWESTPLLYRRHPPLRARLYGGVFFNRTHAAVCGAALGLVLARRRPLLAAAAAAPFVVDSIDSDNVGPRGLLRQAIHIPARFLSEAAQTAGVLRGAARHRSLVI